MTAIALSLGMQMGNQGSSGPPRFALQFPSNLTGSDTSEPYVANSIKIFSAVLSEADMLSESQNFNTVVTSAGQSAIWWGKNGFLDIDDLTCDYGTGRQFAWANANKGTLTDRL